jgi:hypothetical protein
MAIPAECSNSCPTQARQALRPSDPFASATLALRSESGNLDDAGTGSIEKDDDQQSHRCQEIAARA